MKTLRDYKLTGSTGEEAVKSGLANGDWYRSPVDRSEMLALMARSNFRAGVDLTIWVVLLLLSGAWLITTWLTWWTIPAAFIYGTLYGSTCDARWHECGHRTAFASKRTNEIVYHLASFMAVREPVSWRWSHNRHHSETIIVGRDPEIAYPRPTPRWKILAECFGLLSAQQEFTKYATNFRGRLTPEEATFLPDRERSRAIFWGRTHLLIWTAVVLTSVLVQSWLPLMLIGLPSLYGRWLMVATGITQHAGLAEDTFDHRHNTRTVMMNPIVRFLYSNMNFHLEHHMYPAVPYHRLPELHRLIAKDLPMPAPSMWAAYREISRQLKDIRQSCRTSS
jgi:fatty acid desaturase